MGVAAVHGSAFGLGPNLRTSHLGLLGLRRFDPCPFGLLTMVVSLEAIFLSTFVLISQNRQAKVDDRSCTCIQVTHPRPRAQFKFHIARIYVDNEQPVPLRYEADVIGVVQFLNNECWD